MSSLLSSEERSPRARARLSSASGAVRLLRAALLLALLGVVTLSLHSHTARAGWPPKPGDVLSDPSNWPNDPGYGSQWNYWSWLPKQQPNTTPYIPADIALGASGMSIDQAWTTTIGRPEVRIAVIDSGIEWEDPELLNKAYLNAAELAGTKRPQDKNGVVCGGAGALAGYDCDGDGVFTVKDYKDDPRVTPVVTGDKCFTDGARTVLGPDRIRGDVNHNCVFDAGDLILMFSDGVDDDQNGYTDDISGWDFYKNDNDPYDDPRYGHGTGEAENSSAEGNNGMGSLGVCPLCRFVPLRVGSSFIADGNDFAKAVLYAADNGIPVVGEALGGTSLSAFAKAAMDYAYSHGTLVIGSMADENSRHHNLPNVANHVLNVHAVMYNGDAYDTSSSFVSFNHCTNFGGNNMMSVSGANCSSEATGRSAGIAGLLASAALSRSPPLTLSPEELMQLFKMTADVIDVPASRSPDSSISAEYYESRPGFSQRFGYGRPNVARAVQAVVAGDIPPEVDITSPAWFDTLYADRIIGPVSIVGTIAAKRATSYDYGVEWAPGVEPDDSQFQPLVPEVMNLPPGTVTGSGGAPLAVLDPSSINTTHVADPDSPHHENDRTITVRVYAIAHYGSTTVRGESRRTLAIVNHLNGTDPDLILGFPLKMGASVESSPKLADIDGDGVRDIVIAASDGSVHAYSVASGMPVEIAGFPYRTALIDGLNPALADPLVPSYLGAPAYRAGKNGGVDPDLARESVAASPAIADLDGDGKLDIVITTFHGTIHVIDTTGKPKLGFPLRLPLVPSCPLDPSKAAPPICMDAQHLWDRGAIASPVVVDMNADGKLDIVQAAFDGRIHALQLDGTEVSGWPVLVHAPSLGIYNRIVSTPAITDFNRDGVPDVVTGSNEHNGDSGPVFLFDGRGTNTPGGALFPHWPLMINSFDLIPVIAEGVDASPAAADFNGDGVPDVVIQGTGSFYVVLADPGVQTGMTDPPNRLPITTDASGKPQVGFDPSSLFGDLSVAHRPDTFFTALSHPTVGDLDQDGVPDLLLTGDSLSYAAAIIRGGGARVPAQHMITSFSGKTGHMFPGSPVVTEDVSFLVNASVADLDGDNFPEVISGTGGYFMHAANACGVEPAGWPKFTNGWIMASAAIGDIDGDQRLEVVTATRDGYLYAWRTPGRSGGVVQWESFHHDNRNTGDYGVRLEQGVLRQATAPLDCTPLAPAVVRYDAGGGCDVGGPGGAGAAGGGGRGLAAAGGLGALLAMAVRRRSRKACQQVPR